MCSKAATNQNLDKTDFFWPIYLIYLKQMVCSGAYAVPECLPPPVRSSAGPHVPHVPRQLNGWAAPSESPVAAPAGVWTQTNTWSIKAILRNNIYIYTVSSLCITACPMNIAFYNVYIYIYIYVYVYLYHFISIYVCNDSKWLIWMRYALRHESVHSTERAWNSVHHASTIPEVCPPCDTPDPWRTLAATGS